jgi:uncharacterized protein YjbI with pentapeptide repeats
MPTNEVNHTPSFATPSYVMAGIGDETLVPDVLSEDRKADLQAAFVKNSATGKAPYEGVSIRTRDELLWIVAERGWVMEFSSSNVLLPGTNFPPGAVEQLSGGAVAFTLPPVNENVPLLGQRRVDLRGAILDDADLNGIVLHETDLRNASLTNTNLSGANLMRADLRHARLIFTDLREASLDQANLSHAYLDEVHLENAELIQAKLVETVFHIGYLSEANLLEANVAGADLSEALLQGAVLDGMVLDSRVKLAGARFENTDCSRSDGLAQQV